MRELYQAWDEDKPRRLEQDRKQAELFQNEELRRQEFNSRTRSTYGSQARTIPTPVDPVLASKIIYEDVVENPQQYQSQKPRPSTVRPSPIDSVAPAPYTEDFQQYTTRQPRPSSAAPPPTPNTSGAAVEPQRITARPAPALPRSPTPSTNPTIDAPPTSLPLAAGLSPRAQFGGVLLSTAFRVVSGQSPQQALFGATGESLGSVAGAVAGSAFGPIGTFVGGMAGGFIGGKSLILSLIKLSLKLPLLLKT